MQEAEIRQAQLRKRLQELERRWPKHSATMAMALEREELEEEIAQIEKTIAEARRGAQNP